MKTLPRAFDLACHLVFPQSCPVCGRLGVVICPECMQELARRRLMPHCLACGSSSPCPRHEERYPVSALCHHEKAARDALLAAKYERQGLLARELGKALASLIDEERSWTITTVPPHDRLLLFPQGDSHLLWMARGLSEATGFSVRSLLAWRSSQKPQKEQESRQARKKMPPDCFKCLVPPPEWVLLLDDVCTTGTTLLRGAQALYAGGAREVRSLSWSMAVQ